ncbi:hypothetical protein KAH37_05465 [bacterium]|nr:hypothetical protein [bacterium]
MKFSLLLLVLLWVPLFASQDVPLDSKITAKQANILSSALQLEQDGMKIKKVGVPLLAIGLTLTAYTIVAFVIAGQQISNCSGEYCFLEGMGVMFSGSLTYLIGVPMVIVGSALIVKGKRHIKLAQKMKTSLGVAPIINPKKKMYGITLTLKF